MRRTLMLVSAAVLLLMAPLVEVLGTLRLSLLTVPALELAAGLTVAGVCLGAAAAAFADAGTRTAGIHSWAYAACLAAIVLAAVDVGFGGHRLASLLVPASEPLAGAARFAARAGVLGLAWAICAIVMRPIRRAAAPVLCASAAAYFAASIALNASVLRAPGSAPALPPRETSASRLAPFVYIVLDEALGVAASEQRPGGVELAERIRALASRHGFRLYEQAFSRHWTSSRSIPNTLNFDFTDAGYGWDLTYHSNRRVSSRLFARLMREGYEVVSYSTAHLDFCFPGASRCEVLPSFDPFSWLLEPHRTNPRALSARDGFRAHATYRFVQHAFGRSHLVYRYSSWLASRRGAPLPASFVALDSYAFPAWADRLADDLTASPRGRAYFAHLLAPHAPYVLDRGCADTGVSLRPYFVPGPSADQSLERRDAFYAAYFDQFHCVVTKLEQILTRLDERPEFTDATVVIHGDHGSRISAGLQAEVTSARDMVDNYSTLFAVRQPGVRPARDSRRTSVQRLVAEHLSGKPLPELGPDVATVAIDSEVPGRVVLREMPPIDREVAGH